VAEAASVTPPAIGLLLAFAIAWFAVVFWDEPDGPA
jgi:hypothetical protein